MRVGVLALQGDFAEHIEVLRRLEVEAAPVRLPKELEAVDGVIIPGGESTTISQLMVEFSLLEPLRSRIKEGMPVMGTCAGMIVMARSPIGLVNDSLKVMDMEVRRNAFGRQVDSFEADLVFPALGGDPFHAIFIRAPVIQKVGLGVEVLASLNDGRPVAAREANMLALSFHPELTQDHRIHSYFLGMIAGSQARLSSSSVVSSI
ncbi:MAG: glutamine amidotransferase [Dehalococcoidia bacterium]|nr:glutamine amidotransferase [Dehalococcoidia bacterium]